MKEICLNMIVKNESSVIVATLQNIISYIPIDYYVICDTGSTDSTVHIIKTFLSNEKIEGEIYHHEWVDFGTNRTLALNMARHKSKYLLIFDADDSIHGNFKLPFLNNDYDGYQFKFGPSVNYYRPLLINNQLDWKFQGILHEYLTCLDSSRKLQFCCIDGDYHVQSGHTGARSQDPQKYKKDAMLLETAYNNERDTGLASRYSFYCAQSYRDAGDTEKAIQWFKNTCSLNGWNQEQMISCLNIGDLYAKKNDYSQAQIYWLKTLDYDDERMEGVIRACEYLQKTDQHILVNLLYHKYKNYEKVSSKLSAKLFVEKNCYLYKLEYCNSISAFYAKDLKSGYECCKKLIEMWKTIDVRTLDLTWQNLYFYKDEIRDESLQLFTQLNNDLPRFDTVQDLHIKMWEFLKNRNLSLLTPLVTKQIKNRTNPTVFLSITTCRRYDLFETTIRSFIHHCQDVVSIDYWFCVDDNSSEHDRDKMKQSYTWFDFYWKGLCEKGHRQSMNIIYEKLCLLQPKYWIHMEDDFLFYQKEHYICKSIFALERYKHQMSQILWNRNYAETIEHYNIKGYEKLEDSDIRFVIHKHYTEPKEYPYRNNHYWPHFSFRPSMISVPAILKLGNFDSANTFFERDYAEKWYQNGYRSGFFNKICCQHIGKLTYECAKAKPNAYSLNQVSQFDTTPKILISLTSIPRRLSTSAFAAVQQWSLNHDNIPIVLSLPSKYKSWNETFDIPKFESINNVKIYKTNKDYGPATKLLGALEYLKHNSLDYSHILTVDDDCWYKDVNNFIQTIKKYTSLYPNTVLTMQGIKLKHFPYHSQNGLNYSTTNSFVDAPRGYSGVIYPVSRFDVSKIIEFQAQCPEGIFHDDDAFIGVYCGKEKIPIFALEFSNLDFVIDNESNQSGCYEFCPINRMENESKIFQWAVCKNYLPNPS